MSRLPRLVLASLALLLTGCPIMGFEVPVGTAQLAPGAMDTLEVGRSTRADVRSALGTGIAIDETHDVFAGPTGRNATQMWVLFPVPFIWVGAVPVGSGGPCQVRLARSVLAR